MATKNIRARIISPEVTGLPAARRARQAGRRTRRGGYRRGAFAAERFALLNRFVDQHLLIPKLRGGPMAVWLFLYRHAGRNGRVKAGIRHIASKTGLSERQVGRSLGVLLRLELLLRVIRGTQRSGCSRYVMKLPTGHGRPDIQYTPDGVYDNRAPALGAERFRSVPSGGPER